MVTICSSNGISISAQIVDPKTKKLGKFQIHDERGEARPETYASFSDAEGVYNYYKKQREKNNK